MIKISLKIYATFLTVFIITTWLNLLLRINFNNNDQILILFWDECYESTQLPHWCHVPCFKRSLIPKSNAIIVNTYYRTEAVALEMPFINRPFDQLWVFFGVEPPTYVEEAGVNMNLWDDINFNRTMTYRLDSDFPLTYFTVKQRKERLQNFNNVIKIEKKTKLAAWMVSKCGAKSGRDKIATDLSQYMDIDIYGKCGNFTCDIKGERSSCYNKLGENYKFYFAFENSLCTDYATEKVALAMKAGMVPVVYGGAKYNKILPKKSFINVRDFKNARKLANYLLYLDGNLTAYKEYLEWNKLYEIDTTKTYWENQTLVGLRNLCFDLRNGEQKKYKVYEHMKKWWTLGQCQNPLQDVWE